MKTCTFYKIGAAILGAVAFGAVMTSCAGQPWAISTPYGTAASDGKNVSVTAPTIERSK